MTKYVSILLLLLFFKATLLAQTLQGDSTFVSASIENAKRGYLQVMRGQIQLYDGSEYKNYRSLKEEHPYYISDDWIFGTIQYGGNSFENVTLLYNIFTDGVIVENFSGGNMIQLVSEKITYFILDGHTFVRLQENTIPKGFYDRLCNGEIKVYAKRIKEFQETISATEIQHDFIEKNRYYIYKDGHYYPVRSKKSVLQVLGDQKHELNQFIHKNHLGFRKNREQTIVKLTEFYNRK